MLTWICSLCSVEIMDPGHADSVYLFIYIIRFLGKAIVDWVKFQSAYDDATLFYVERTL